MVPCFLTMRLERSPAWTKVHLTLSDDASVDAVLEPLANVLAKTSHDRGSHDDGAHAHGRANRAVEEPGYPVRSRARVHGTGCRAAKRVAS